MEVTEDDRDREEHDVTRVPAEQANQFYYLGKTKHEGNFHPEQNVPIPGLPVFRTPPAREEQERINDEGQRSEGGNMQGVRAPRLLPMVFVMVRKPIYNSEEKSVCVREKEITYLITYRSRTRLVQLLLQLLLAQREH